MRVSAARQVVDFVHYLDPPTLRKDWNSNDYPVDNFS